MLAHPKKNLKLQDEGSWALMIEECNVKALQQYHGNMAGLNIDYYLSIGKERYYKDYLSEETIEKSQVQMINFLLNDDQYSACLQKINSILERMKNAEKLYIGSKRIDQFVSYYTLLCEYIAYYNSVIADAFYQKIYDIADKSIPAQLQFASRPLKDALFATNNSNLLSHMQTVDLIKLSKKYLSNELLNTDIEKYIEKYKSTTASSGNPNGITAEELMEILSKSKMDKIQIQSAFLDNLHFRYQNADVWSKATANMIDLDQRTQVLIRRTSELSYIKILMREEFQKFKLITRNLFLNELISEIGKEQFDHMRINEICEYINTNRRVSYTEITTRKQLSVFELVGNKIKFTNRSPEYVVIRDVYNLQVLKGDVLIGNGVRKYKVKKVKQDKIGLNDFDVFINTEKDKENIAIVTNVLRPFLVPKLRHFGALITQYGGYTSHASVLCRELGINSIISVDGVMNSLETDDHIKIDFDSGKIVKIEDMIDEEYTTNEIIVPLQSDSIYPKEVVGSKAANLIKVCKKANVPQGFVLTTYALKNIDNISIQEKIMEEIALLKCPFIIIRSSHESEDRDHSSYAGLYESYVNVDVLDREKIFSLIKAVYCSGNENVLDKYIEERSGEMHVIIQEMIKADISGVILTSVPYCGYEYMLTEYTTGDLCYLMQGEVTPAVAYISKIDILNSKSEFASYPAIISANITASFFNLSRVALDLENLFSHRLEIEWGIKDGKVYIFQARYY